MSSFKTGSDGCCEPTALAVGLGFAAIARLHRRQALSAYGIETASTSVTVQTATTGPKLGSVSGKGAKSRAAQSM